MPQGRKRRADDGEKRMKKECTEQDLQRFVQDAKLAFEDVTLTELDEDSSRYWQDDGLMVDYELRNGQVGCVLRRQIFAEGRVWELQMTAPLAGSGLPEDRMTPRERELCREDMNHDFLTGVFNRRYFETEFCTRLDEWADQHRCASLALVALAIRQTRQLPLDAETLAFAQLGHLAAFAARWLPAGAAWLLTLAAALFGASLARSFAQAVHYEVWHTATQIGSRGGWIDRFECRVRSAQISYADVRVSPAARVLKRWPVFVTAGCCTPELPLFVYRSGGEALFRELLPEFQMPPDVRADTTQRSLIFFAPVGIPFALCALLSLVSVTVLPAMTVTLLVPTVFFFVLLCGAVMGYTREGIWLREGKVTLRRQEGVYLHCICVFHPDLCLMGFQSPWAANVRRTNLTLIFPGQVRLKVRSIPLAEANAVVRFLEQESH